MTTTIYIFAGFGAFCFAALCFVLGGMLLEIMKGSRRHNRHRATLRADWNRAGAETWVIKSAKCPRLDRAPRARQPRFFLR